MNKMPDRSFSLVAIMGTREQQKELSTMKSFLPVDIFTAAVQEKRQAVNRSQALGKAGNLGVLHSVLTLHKADSVIEVK